MIKVKVRASVIVEVEFEDGDTDDFIHFDIVENHCPGTGRVGAAIDTAMSRGDAAKTCWGCALEGENEIVSIERAGTPKERP